MNSNCTFYHDGTIFHKYAPVITVIFNNPIFFSLIRYSIFRTPSNIIYLAYFFPLCIICSTARQVSFTYSHSRTLLPSPYTGKVSPPAHSNEKGDDFFRQLIWTEVFVGRTMIAGKLYVLIKDRTSISAAALVASRDYWGAEAILR